MSIQLCVTSKSRRRSTTSARAPPGSASKTIGRLPAVSTSATSIGDVVRETMSQDSPTSCIHVPMLDATVAIHSARKIGSARGLHGETASCPSFDVAAGRASSVCAGRLMWGFLFSCLSDWPYLLNACALLFRSPKSQPSNEPPPSITTLLPKASFLPPTPEGFVKLNQREQLVAPNLGQTQFSRKQILIRVQRIEHRVHAAAKSHIR